MPRIRLQALVDVTHEGRRVPAGAPFDADPLDAAALVYQHRALMLPLAPAVSAPAGRTRRTYRRRDLQAEA